ncbi:MAG TPA: hypothetical protein VF576_12805, partial [Rubricoccaceae bacterium]
MSARPRLRRASDPRTGLYLTLGATLVAPAAGTVALSGCGPSEEPPSPEAAVPLTGVETVIQQQPDGSYLIADERVVEGRAGGVTIVHRDSTGATRTERLDSPEAFAARLPATPPDSAEVASGGAGGSFGGNGQQAQAGPGMGYGL